MSVRVRALGLLVAAVLVVPLVGASPAAAAPPANDARAAAVDIGALPAAEDGTTAEATLEADEPPSSCSGALKGSVWYRFAPTKSRSIFWMRKASSSVISRARKRRRTSSRRNGPTRSKHRKQFPQTPA